MRNGLHLCLIGLLHRLERSGFDPSLKVHQGQYYLVTGDGIRIEYQGYHPIHSEYFRVFSIRRPEVSEEHILLKEVVRMVKRLSRIQKQEV
jgi:hypothetical protein